MHEIVHLISLYCSRQRRRRQLFFRVRSLPTNKARERLTLRSELTRHRRFRTKENHLFYLGRLDLVTLMVELPSPAAACARPPERPITHRDHRALHRISYSFYFFHCYSNAFIRWEPRKTKDKELINIARAKNFYCLVGKLKQLYSQSESVSVECLEMLLICYTIFD